MFRCEVSGRLSNPREAEFKLITKAAAKEYRDVPGPEGNIIGFGWEIVEEKRVCEHVYYENKGRQDAAIGEAKARAEIAASAHRAKYTEM